jgi:TPR repeat protein
MFFVATIITTAQAPLPPELSLGEAQAKALAGDPEAQFQLACRLDAGNGLAVDQSKSREWMEKAARQGHRYAMMDMGAYWLSGHGGPKDPKTALDWYLKAAELGEGEAQYMVAAMYNGDRGLPADEVKSRFWAKRSAENGNARGQYAYSLDLLKHGQTKEENKLAIEYLRRSADQGFPFAEQMYAQVCMMDTPDHPKDFLKAFKYLKDAADHGIANAQFNLGVLYLDGTGVPQDTVEAMKWFKLAAAQGHPQAQDAVVKHEDILKKQSTAK